MVCSVCRKMFYGQAGSVWKYRHHTSYESLWESSKQNCGICRALYEDFKSKVTIDESDGEFKSQANEAGIADHASGIVAVLAAAAWFVSTGAFSLVSSALSILCFKSLSSSWQVAVPATMPLANPGELATMPLSVHASLSVHMNSKVEHLYRLDMTLHYERKKQQFRFQRTFFLENPKDQVPPHQSRSSHNTSSREVFATAEKWLKRCHCARTRTRDFYPSRLISLEQLKKFQDEREEPFIKEHPDTKVYLVDTRHWLDESGEKPGYSEENKEYVTLSHCWGDKVNSDYRLSVNNLDDFSDCRKGIPFCGMPKTFKDAILSAAKLENVGYIWIDSLCIIQDGDDGKDWLQQSAEMDRVYSETYLNLSATASSNSEGGLFRLRNPDALIREDIILNTRGLPGAYPEFGYKRVNSHTMATMEDSFDKSDGPYLRPCTILDAGLWTDRVEKGPVNRRAWVLQERLMSPRVLHFCQDQIAWECLGSTRCNGFNAVEEQPDGLSNFQLTSRGIVKGMRLKDLNIDCMDEQIALEHWAQIVEAYSKTNLTRPTDKLIALSGMAKMMNRKINRQYVAGLWGIHLESQLLWRVEPLFDHSNGTFSHPAESPSGYRAPSFSWAALDAIDHGIVYGNITGEGMLIKVQKVEVTPHVKGNPYGLISSDPAKRARVFLKGKLRAARLFQIEKGRYAWQLMTGRKELDREQHRNVYLDCPERDQECIDNQNAPVYVVPAAEVRDSAAPGVTHLWCLMLKLRRDKGSGVFSRIGTTKLTHYLDKQAMDLVPEKKEGEILLFEQECAILVVSPSDIDMPHTGLNPETGEPGWNRETGQHSICLI